MATTGAKGTFRGHLIPEDHRQSKLGDTDREWRSVTTQDVTASGDVAVTGNVTITGDLAVTGTTTLATELGTAGTGVVAVDEPAVRQTTLTLTNVVVSVVSVTTGAGVGGTAVWTAPAVAWRFLGATANLGISVATAKQADFTDNTPEGDLGVGTLAPANADALGTDSTDDDFCTAAAFAMTAFNDASTALVTEAVSLQAASQDVFVNVLVDAADIDNDVTTEVLINGTITLTWVPLA